MKFKTTIFLCCLSAFFVLMLGDPGGAQQTAQGPWDRVGVVSVMKVMQLSQKYAEHRKSVTAEQNGWRAELQSEAQALEADKLSLDTMRPGSADHTEQVRKMMMKQAQLKATEEFYNQMASQKAREWTQKMYQELLVATSEVAREMRLRMVFERAEPEFPMPSDQLISTMNTHKLLFHDGLVEITDEVTNKIDAR